MDLMGGYHKCFFTCNTQILVHAFPTPTQVLGEVPKMAILAFCFVAPLVAIAHWTAPVQLLYFATLISE